MSRNEKIKFLAALVIVAVAFFAIGVGLTASFDKVEPAKKATETPVTPPPPNEFLTSTQESFRDIVAAVSPAVCTVEVITRIPGMGYAPYDMFGPSPGPGQQPEGNEFEMPSSGSGFIVSPEGYILTNNHVVQGADEVKVILDGNQEYDAQIVGLDPATDVAVLKIESEGSLPYIKLGDSDAIQVGDWVMAIGNPFGYLDHSVTVGVISAKNREKITGTQYENFLQTDAAINFGNSGGPLVDIYGRAVGINAAITSQGSGIGFAVPINMAKAVYEDFVQFGEVMRGWVGITIEDVTPERLEELGLDTTEGALVTSVSKDDPADQAGVKVDDFIIKIDGERIRSASHLSRTVAGKEIGKAMEVILTRDGKEMTVRITPDKRPEDAIIRGGDNIVDIQELGFTIRDIDDEMREEIGIPDDVAGVIISNVQQRSNAAQKGLRAGIIITHIEDESVESVEEFVKVFAKYKTGEKIIIDVLYVRNDGSTDTDVIALKIE